MVTGFSIAEVLASAFDEEPEGESNLADEGELPNADRGTWYQHCNEPVGDVSKPGDHKQYAEDLRHEAGAIREVADQQQMDAEQDQANEPDRVVRINCAQRLVRITQEPERNH